MSERESKQEAIKRDSDYLTRGVSEQLEERSQRVSDSAAQLLKFFGVQQQDDRDVRKERQQRGCGRAYMFMIRSKLPGGVLTAEQYLLHDELAGRFGNGTLRFTTRQGIQLHGVLKGDIRAILRQLNERLVTTLGASGDVNRSVVACPCPERSAQRSAIAALARTIDRHLLPRSTAYYELWLDGKHIPTPSILWGEAVDEIEPLYGRTYLPRKFKIGIASPHDNCIDVFTQDVGLITVFDDGHLLGCNVLVGGGLGMSYGRPETHPRLADPLGFVPRALVVPTVEAIVGIHRDHGERGDRKLARMKYLLEAWGVERFRVELQRRLGTPVQPWVEVGPLAVDDHLGWRDGGDGTFSYGVPVANGRVGDGPGSELRSALRAVVRRFRPGLRITPRQDVILTGLEAGAHAPLKALLASHGVEPVEALSGVRRHAMACPALPTCDLALTESERLMPLVVERLEHELQRLGMAQEPLAVRMTGCPNGCAHPYTAELAFIGCSPGLYNVYVGGGSGRRLVELFARSVKADALVTVIAPLLRAWSAEREHGEAFGDYCARLGAERIRERFKTGITA